MMHAMSMRHVLRLDDPAPQINEPWRVVVVVGMGANPVTPKQHQCRSGC